MATKIKAIAESKAPLCSHFTTYRQIYHPGILSLLSLIICTVPLALCQEYVVVIIPSKFKYLQLQIFLKVIRKEQSSDAE